MARRIEGPSQSQRIVEDEDPQAFDCEDWFAARIHHGGEFVYHPKIVYLGGEVETVTRIDKDRVSMTVLNKFYKTLGYNDYCSFYYLLPGNVMDRGLMLMSTEKALTDMIEGIDPNNRIVDVYCKHSEDYQDVRKDNESFNVVDLDCEEEDREDDNSSLYSDSAYGDTDVEVDDEEWILNESKDKDKHENVTQETQETGKVAQDKGKGKVVQDKGKGKVTNDDFDFLDGLDDFDVDPEPERDQDNSDEFESLDGSDFEEEDPRKLMGRKPTPKFKRFNPITDMKNPKFELGMEFTDHNEFKNAVRSYAVKIGKGIRFVKNDRVKVSAKCKEGCPWYIYGSQLGGEKNTFRIRTFVDNHKCSRVVKVQCVNSKWVGNKYTDRYKLNPTWPSESFFNTVGKELEIQMSRSSAYRALQFARQNAELTLEQQYGALWDYKEELIRSNPGTSVEIVCEHENEKPLFKRIYVCLGGLKKGFLEGCRKVIGLDGCFLKGPVKGMILSAVGVDANNGMWPLAYAVVEGENRDSWSWFLELLLVDIGCVNSYHWTFISDKQKGLVPSLEALVPNAEIRFCVKHLHDNFKLKFRGNALKKQLYACAKASYIQKFNIEMEKLKQQSTLAYDWLAGKTPAHWSRAFFSTDQCCDMLLNNLCETFNSCILKARCKPILDLLEWIKMYMMSRLQKCREKMRDYPGLLCPRIIEKLDKNKKESHGFICVWAGIRKYQVRGMYGDQYDVDLNSKVCSCRKWQLSGIPCAHAISALNHNQLDPEHYVAHWYKKETYMKSYEHMVFPMRGFDMWPKTNLQMHPPKPIGQMPGRPKRRRIRQLDESKGKPNKLRRYQDTVRCKICGEEYHNARTCPQKPAPDTRTTTNNETVKKASSAGNSLNAKPKRTSFVKKKGTLLWNNVLPQEEIAINERGAGLFVSHSDDQPARTPSPNKIAGITKKHAMRTPDNPFSKRVGRGAGLFVSHSDDQPARTPSPNKISGITKKQAMRTPDNLFSKRVHKGPLPTGTSLSQDFALRRPGFVANLKGKKAHTQGDVVEDA